MLSGFFSESMKREAEQDAAGDPGNLQEDHRVAPSRPALPTAGLLGLVMLVVVVTMFAYSVVEKKLKTSGTASSVSEDWTSFTAMPDDAKLFGGKFYRLFPGGIPWTEAKIQSERIGGHLAMVKDQETADFFRTVKRPGQRVWLGATDVVEEGDWRWVDGTKVEFDNRATNQPHNLAGAEHYMEFSIKGTFNDVGLEGPAG